MLVAMRIEPDIVSSNISSSESGISAWDKDTDYAIGDVVQGATDTNKLYRALQASKSVKPEDDVNINSGIGSRWMDYGATNYYRAFDALSSSKCSHASKISYKFKTSDVNVLMLGNVDASEVNIKVTKADDDGNYTIVLLDVTESLQARMVYDWYDWTYAKSERVRNYFKILPMGFDTQLEVTLTGTNISVGHIVYGQGISVGLSLANPAPTTSNRSITAKSRDEWGNIVTRRKIRYKRMTINCMIDSIAIDTIQDRIERFVDTPCVFVGDERDGGYKSLLIYGELKDHDMPIGIVKTSYQLEVEGYI